MAKHDSAGSSGQRIADRSRNTRASASFSLKKQIKTVFAATLLALLTLIAVVLVGGLSAFWRFSSAMPNVETITTDFHEPVATTIWSQDGVMLGRLSVENRQPITLDQIPKNVLDATIAVEDHRFYEHPGVDIVGIGRATYANLRGSSLRQGASTLTQQLVRQPSFASSLGLSFEKKYSRKFREALIALRLEQVYSKNEIIQLYLNHVYYGSGAYGIQAASQTYFGKSAAKLSLAEAALLAGIPQRPSAFTPVDNRQAAVKRRDEVLDRMAEYGYITKNQCESAKLVKPVIMARQERRNFAFKAPYFVTYVLRNLTKRYGSDFVYSGLKIETTLNWKMQQSAEDALYNGLKTGEGLGANQGALVSIDAQTGYIRAMVGGRNFYTDQYNAVTQGRRQPGSTFKLFDYCAAFDTETATLHKAYLDKPISYVGDPQHRVVKNYGGGYSHKYIDCLSAIKFSKNTIAVQVAQDVGIDTVIRYAHSMGIQTELDPYLPTALGASAVRPLDLCSAYSVLPMKGSRNLPMSIVRITDGEGNIIDEAQPQLIQNILKPETVAQMDEALAGVVQSGTGTRARGTTENGIIENAHGKTGTTSDNRDAWFAGYTPELTTVIWVASVHRNRSGKISYSEMQGATGGQLCAPIWHNFMVTAVPEQKKFQVLQQPGIHDTPQMPGASESRAISNNKKVRPDTKPIPQDTLDDTVSSPPDNPESSTPTESDPQNSDTPAIGNESTKIPPRPIESTQSSAAIDSVPNTTPLRTVPPVPAPVAPPSVRISAPKRAVPEMTSVMVCVDSNDLATQWCEATKSIRVSLRRAARMHRCRLHNAPPGE